MILDFIIIGDYLIIIIQARLNTCNERYRTPLKGSIFMCRRAARDLVPYEILSVRRAIRAMKLL